MFLLLQPLLLMLIAVFFVGCGGDEDSSVEIPVVTLEKLQEESEGVWFRLNATPPPTRDLAVLIASENLEFEGEHLYTWVMIPSFSSAKEFRLSLDESFSWEVRIKSLSGINPSEYLIEGSEIPANFEFRSYRVGEPSGATASQNPPAKLLEAFPRSGVGLVTPIPANATLTFIFDAAPKDIKVSQGRAITDGEVLTISGPFPLGDITVEIGWDKGRESYTWRHVITKSDFEPPKAVRARAPEAFQFWGFFNDELNDGRLPDIELIEKGLVTWSLSPDAELIDIYFSEAVWVHEKVTGNMDIQTEDGTNLGWQAEDGFLFDQHKITLSLSDGRPLNPATNYVVSGKVTDLANETEVKIPFATSW